jgi:6-phosphogluconolactonase
VAYDIVPCGKAGHEILVFPSKEESFRFLSARFREISERCIEQRGFFAAALSGGTTPTGFYAELSRDSGGINWKHVHIFFVDERFVPSADSQSNYGMIKEVLLDVVSIPPANIHPIATDASDPSASARHYEGMITDFFRLRPGAVPELDFILLGLGEDGHTASLFPGPQTEAEEQHFVRAVAPAKERLARITLTFPVINNGRHVFFLVTGKAKAPIVRRLVDDDSALPAAQVAPCRGELSLVCDSEAASLLSMKGRDRPSKA